MRKYLSYAEKQTCSLLNSAKFHYTDTDRGPGPTRPDKVCGLPGLWVAEFGYYQPHELKPKYLKVISWNRRATDGRSYSASSWNKSKGLLQSAPRYRERKCADTTGTVPVPWIGHFQCWNTDIFPNKIYESSFIKQHSETVMVWNYHQYADCSLRKKLLCYLL